MLYKISSETVNIHEGHTQNFTLNNLTIPLARKLAVAVFINSGSEAEQIQGFKTDDAVYNTGNIITEDYMRPPVISRDSSDTQKSHIGSPPNIKVPAPGMRNSAQSHDYTAGLRLWRSFISILLLTWKNLLDNKPEK